MRNLRHDVQHIGMEAAYLIGCHLVWIVFHDIWNDKKKDTLVGACPSNGLWYLYLFICVLPQQGTVPS
jgi:hypothetical protein